MPEGTIERPLSPSLPRDCGHECRVCKVTVVSLTDYAGHISSPTHKQNVEAAERKHAGNEREEDYFDQGLVDLIEKRKEQLRKEKEAAAAKLTQEEEDRRREEFQQRLKEAKERYRVDCGWKQQQQGFGGSGQHNTWYRNNQYNTRPGEQRPWHNNKQGKSATWHAQEPPDFQRWTTGEPAGGSWHGHERWNRKQWDQGGYSGNQQNRLPWLSNGGSSNGLYGHNNISQYPQRSRPLSLLGPISARPPMPSFFSWTFNQFQNAATNQEGQQGGDGVQNGEGQTSESDHSSNRSSKSFGSNPKPDKACRWSPYPVANSAPHKDANVNTSEKHPPKVPKQNKPDRLAETGALNRTSQPEQKQAQLTSSGKSVEEKEKHKSNPKTKPRDGSNSNNSSSSSSSSRSNSAQREAQPSSTPAPSNQKQNKSSKDKTKEKKTSSAAAAQLSKASNQTHGQSKSPEKQSGLGSKAPSVGNLKSKPEQRQFSETYWRVKQMMLEKHSSLDNKVEEQQRDQVGVNKENSCRQNAAKPNVPEPVRTEKAPSDSSSQFLQLLQVSTSTAESPEPAAPSRDDDRSGKNAEKPTDEAAGQSSESDTSRSGEAQAAPAASSTSGTNATSLSKLDLPPVLKRDLTKHISSSKSKTGSHEPNLNIARRVRNLSESRRSDTEKDSGLKPTVRQLISSSGSRRNVNWEQVYQEVRKKQDKGKGMPRFGIEMVPNELEDQSQEEDDIPLLEGFQWESLMDISAPASSRKRSLSESSVAPASTASLLASLTSKEPTQREKQQGNSAAAAAAAAFVAQGNKDDRCQQELEQMLDVKVEKQPNKLTSATVKALQRSDSVIGDSSSGTEQVDGQGTGKRRRAAGDVPSAETSGVEHNSKRRKVKSKKDRLQIDQLLAVSLREEELSRSLQSVDTSLIQARAALEAAYMEVQRLMVVKQQVTVEMSTLRNKRIELLKGMQAGSMEEAPQLKLKEEKMDTDSLMSSSVTDATPAPSPSPPAQRSSPLSSSLPIMPVTIKQEPQSPIHVSSELENTESITHCAHSTTPELPARPAADAALNVRFSHETKSEQSQTNKDHLWESFRDTSDCKESLSAMVELTEKSMQAAAGGCNALDSKAPKQSRRGSEAADSFTTPAAPSLLDLPPSPSELSGGKRVRKLKKRKVLKKAQGAEQPESSDTELDGEPTRPRWLRSRRRPSGGSQVSTSTLPTAEDANVESGGEEARRTQQQRPAVKQEEVDRASSKDTTELPHATPAELIINLDSEENMEVTADCQPPHVVPDSLRPEPQSLACNEVTSTSDMDICKSSESEQQFPVKFPTETIKISSDASSDHGEDDMPTEGLFGGHQEAVNAMQIHNGLLYTCSGDRTVKVFDLVSHKCVGVFEGHSSKVSSLLVSTAPFLNHRLYSGSSDQTIRCYSLKTQELERQFSLSDRVLCLHSRGKTLYAGLANGTVVTFNLKTNKQMDVFECHGPRGVSCLASSQEGARRILLAGSYDSTISVRDAKNGLLLRTLEGHTKTVLCMKVVNDLVFSGSSDQCVYVHNIHTGELVRVYKGHSHAVTVVSILGRVMVTGCLDKLVRVFDLQSHEQLQVYGGHKDMVMCMAVHKSMIYTGCYDGSVRAVKLNLMQNYRCLWHGCSLVFGLTDHLQQHLINDHAGANFQTLKCRWRNCEEFFCSRNSCSKQAMLVHMNKHAEETELEP